MWINFDVLDRAQKFAVRPFLGGVNGVSGEVMVGDPAAMLRQTSSPAPKQDYIVLPEQQWLDGIATRPGVVRQFVATPLAPPTGDMEPAAPKPAEPKHRLTGCKRTRAAAEEEDGGDGAAGASIEWQVTGRDEVGGIQLQLIPAFDVKSMHAGPLKDVCPGFSRWFESYAHTHPTKAPVHDVLKTPAEEGLRAGDVIHVKDLKTRRAHRPKVVADLARESQLPPPAGGVIELEVYRRKANEINFNMFLPGQLKPEVSLKVCSAILYARSRFGKQRANPDSQY